MARRRVTGEGDAPGGATAEVAGPALPQVPIPQAGPETSRAPDSPGPYHPRTLRQRIDDHPVGLFLGIVIAAITATLTIVVPILQLTQDSRVAAVQAELADVHAQLEQAQRDRDTAIAEERAKAQARVDELERSLSGITRTLGTDTDYYDVSNLVVEPEDASSIPDTSLFDPTDRFYALDPAHATGWTSEVTTELRVSADLFGMTEDQIRANQPAQLIENLTRFPLHVWYFGDDRIVELKDPVGGTPLTLHPRTMTMLQRVSHQQYIEFQLSQLPESAAGAKDVIEAGFARDPAGWVLQDQLVSDISSSGSLRPRIESLQKRDDIAYGRVETVLPEVTVVGTQLPEYYWTREFLIVDSGADLYLVKLFVADDDHRAPDYAAVSSWLDGLRIVRS